MKQIPKCGKCNDNHYGFQSCPEPVVMVGKLGPNYGWGAPLDPNVRDKQAEVVWRNAAQPMRGRLIGPDGNDYEPPSAA